MSSVNYKGMEKNDNGNFASIPEKLAALKRNQRSNSMKLQRLLTCVNFGYSIPNKQLFTVNAK